MAELISELNGRWERLGFFVRFKDGMLRSYNAYGDGEVEYGTGCGVIQATQSPWNPDGVGACENVVWMVLGTDETGVKSAADALINRHDEFKYAYAIIVANGEIIKVPK